MKLLNLILGFLLASFLSYGQKPTIQLDTYKSWPEVNNGGISNDGKFAFYQILNHPVSKNTFVLRSTTNKWAMEVINLSNPNFSEDTQYLFGVLPNDTLLIFNLTNHSWKKLPGVIAYELKNINKRERLILKRSSEALCINNLNGKQLISYPKVTKYKLSADGYKLFIEQRANLQYDKVICKWIDMTSQAEKTIYEGGATSSLIFDDKADQLAFMVNVKDANSIFYYKTGRVKAQLIADNNSIGIKKGLCIELSEYWGFSKDGERIFISLNEKGVIDTGKSSKYEIWSYLDVKLKSEYYDRSGKLENRPASHYLTSVRVSDGFIRQLLQGDERVVGNTFSHDTDTLLLVESSFGPLRTIGDPDAKMRYHFCQTKTDVTRPFIADQKIPISNISISPAGKYIIYFDREKEGYYCYEIATALNYKISGKISNDLYESSTLQFDRNYKAPLGVIGWLKDDKSVIINGTFDFFKLDPRNHEEPVNLTQAIGKKEGIVFNLAKRDSKGFIGVNGRLLLSAFNTHNKDLGFYEISLDGAGTTKKLSMNPVFCNHLEVLHTTMDANELLKAKDADIYIVRTQAADKAPNYFVSRDLKTFSPISDVQPQQAYNWMTSELHNYKDSAGNAYQGVLYKPENFDPKITYPIVFYYYTRKSYLLNSFQSVEVPIGNCSIAFLVSKGYLVFLPDMHGDSNFDGNGALRSILAAADHLKQFPYVDQSKMGIIGGSYGGYHTNYIVTHTSRFAAAISSAGPSNLFTFATEMLGGRIHESVMEHLIKDLDDGIKNSPIFYAKNVETPFLMLHNKADGGVGYLQSQSFFLMLRSLQKKAWWLSYKGEDHALLDSDNQLDWAGKVFGFFDHYLRNQPEPEWMKDHVKSSYE